MSKRRSGDYAIYLMIAGVFGGIIVWMAFHRIDYRKWIGAVVSALIFIGHSLLNRRASFNHRSYS
jgi:hypothetical protein